jgi:hypothetical protein
LKIIQNKFKFEQISQYSSSPPNIESAIKTNEAVDLTKFNKDKIRNFSIIAHIGK